MEIRSQESVMSTLNELEILANEMERKSGGALLSGDKSTYARRIREKVRLLRQELGIISLVKDTKRP